MSSDLALRVVCGVVAIGSIAATVAAVSRSNSARDHPVCAGSEDESGLRVRVESRGVEVAGIARGTVSWLRRARPSDRQWAAALQIRVADADTSLPGIAGRYALIGDALRFTPAYPFISGQPYRVRLDRAHL